MINISKKFRFNLLVNGVQFLIPNSCKTLFQSLSFLYFKIPHFCYNKKLFISGNCRMCLVEISGLAKPISSCTFPVRPGLELKLNSPKINKSKENISEFLLTNHPLDCPVCDQGGECDLQNITFKYGSGSSRFYFSKQNKPNIQFKGYINSSMNKCINCTRCIRFNYFIGFSYLGLFSRSNKSSINLLYWNKKKFNPLLNNLSLICPVEDRIKKNLI